MLPCPDPQRDAGRYGSGTPWAAARIQACSSRSVSSTRPPLCPGVIQALGMNKWRQKCPKSAVPTARGPPAHSRHTTSRRSHRPLLSTRTRVGLPVHRCPPTQPCPFLSSSAPVCGASLGSSSVISTHQCGSTLSSHQKTPLPSDWLLCPLTGSPSGGPINKHVPYFLTASVYHEPGTALSALQVEFRFQKFPEPLVDDSLFLLHSWRMPRQRR